MDVVNEELEEKTVDGHDVDNIHAMLFVVSKVKEGDKLNCTKPYELSIVRGNSILGFLTRFINSENRKLTIQVLKMLTDWVSNQERGGVNDQLLGLVKGFNYGLGILSRTYDQDIWTVSKLTILKGNCIIAINAVLIAHR